MSPDRPSKLAESESKHDLGYTLLSDSEMRAARAFGVAYRVDRATRNKLAEFGIDLEKASGQDHHLLPVPAVFLIDTSGTIRFSYADPDHRQRINTEVLISVARAEARSSEQDE